MPRTAIDYSKSQIYRIVCKNPKITDCFIGSTTNLTHMRSNHHRDSKQENPKLHQKLYRFIRENGGWSNFQLILIESCPCNGKEELIIKLREYIENLNPTLN